MMAAVPLIPITPRLYSFNRSVGIKPWNFRSPLFFNCRDSKQQTPKFCCFVRVYLSISSIPNNIDLKIPQNKDLIAFILGMADFDRI